MENKIENTDIQNIDNETLISSDLNSPTYQVFEESKNYNKTYKNIEKLDKKQEKYAKSKKFFYIFIIYFVVLTAFVFVRIASSFGLFNGIQNEIVSDIVSTSIIQLVILLLIPFLLYKFIFKKRGVKLQKILVTKNYLSKQ